MQLWVFCSDMIVFTMNAILASVLLYHTAGSERFPTASIPELDIVVNPDKGFVLQRVGTYSRNVAKGILHTFVPLRGLCTTLPSAEVCERAFPLMNQNSMTLGTVIASRHKDWALSHFGQEEMSRLITRNVNEMLSNYAPGEFLTNITTNLHFYDGYFYVAPSDSHPMNKTREGFSQENLPKKLDNTRNAGMIVVEQLKNNRVGFPFLTNTEMKSFLSPVMSSIDLLYANAEGEELMTDFFQLIVSQTVTAFRSCSLSQEIQSCSPSLIISTLFLRPSYSNVDAFAVYHLHPLPIIANGFKYIYANLPSTFGFNAIDQRLISWDIQKYPSGCDFSKFVTCPDEQMSISLSSSPCLNHLLTNESIDTNACRVIRIPITEPAFFNVAQDVWVFNAMEKDHYCRQYSSQTKSYNTFVIKEPTIVRLPCGTGFTCADIDIPSKSCQNRAMSVKALIGRANTNQQDLLIPLKPLAARLVSMYRANVADLLRELADSDHADSSAISRILRKVANLAIYLVSALILTTLLTLGTIIKNKFQKRMNRVEREMNTLSDIFIHEENLTEKWLFNSFLLSIWWILLLWK